MSTLAIITPGRRQGARWTPATSTAIVQTTPTARRRSRNVPALSELGYAVNLENMKGLVAPAATPDEAIAYMQERFAEAMRSDTFATLAARANIGARLSERRGLRDRDDRECPPPSARAIGERPEAN